jgi:hypothetical protein
MPLHPTSRTLLSIFLFGRRSEIWPERLREHREGPLRKVVRQHAAQVVSVSGYRTAALLRAPGFCSSSSTRGMPVRRQTRRHRSAGASQGVCPSSSSGVGRPAGRSLLAKTFLKHGSAEGYSLSSMNSLCALERFVGTAAIDRRHFRTHRPEVSHQLAAVMDVVIVGRPEKRYR